MLLFQTPVSPSIKISPTLPIDLPVKPSQADAVAFAWQSFVALNWPVLATARGVPDKSRKIGQPGPVVWHTWKQIEEVFLPNGAAPASWESYGSALPPPCGSGAADAPQAGDLVLAQTSKVRADSNGNNALELADEVVGGSLTDQHGNLARYEIRFNKTQFDSHRRESVLQHTRTGCGKGHPVPGRRHGGESVMADDDGSGFAGRPGALPAA